jgi:hypothetical protein
VYESLICRNAYIGGQMRTPRKQMEAVGNVNRACITP